MHGVQRDRETGPHWPRFLLGDVMGASSTAKPRNRMLNVRLMEREELMVMSAALARGVSVSELARTAIMNASARILAPERTP